MNIQKMIYALAASPGFAEDGICFAAGAQGLLRSADGGESWTDAYRSLEIRGPLTTTSVAVSPDFCEDRTIFAGTPGGILRSLDGGNTWSTFILPAPPPFITTLVVSPDFRRDGVVIAGSMEDGVLRSGDRGGHWSFWNFGLLDLNVFAMAISPSFAEDDTLYVGAESGVFFSTTGGRAWREVNFPMEFAPVLSLALSPEYAEDGVIFAGSESNGLFKSENFGNSWVRMGADIVDGAVNQLLVVPDFVGNPMVVALTSDSLLVSMDGGRSWSLNEDGRKEHAGYASLAAPQGADGGSKLLVGTVDGQIFWL